VPPSVVSPPSDESTYPRVFKEKNAEALQRHHEEKAKGQGQGQGSLERYFADRLQSYVLEKFYEGAVDLKLPVLHYLVFDFSLLLSWFLF
jgi:hypothetical protein